MLTIGRRAPVRIPLVRPLLLTTSNSILRSTRPTRITAGTVSPSAAFDMPRFGADLLVQSRQLLIFLNPRREFGIVFERLRVFCKIASMMASLSHQSCIIQVGNLQVQLTMLL